MGSGDVPRLSLEDVALPEPRADVPLAEAEDVHAEDILTANDVPLTADGLQLALDSGIELLQAAAARVAGAHGEVAVGDSLRALASGTGDTDRAAAAYALARLGEPDGVAALIACLDLPVEAYVAPVQAAGSLARLGDSRGLGVVERAMRSSNELVRAVATKQLGFFGEEGRPLLEQALEDPDSEIVRQARHLLETQRPRLDSNQRPAD
jgi:HEAT repeat protein